MTTNCILNTLTNADIEEIVTAFKSIGWNKPASIYQAYLKDQTDGRRIALVAKEEGIFCGYVTIKFKSEYPAFGSNIPEISDLNVLPNYRKKGIGTLLVAACEGIARDKGYTQIGIGVGMTADYGSAQRLYPRLGYIPDGCGLHYQNRSLNYGDKVNVDDDLVLYSIKSLK